MINFVIYEDKELVRSNYKKMIHKFMGKSDAAYKIYEFGAYTDKLKDYICNNVGQNIYILDIEVPGKSGLDLAREIRNTGDIESQLIVVTAHKELLDNNFINRSLVLNFVSKYDNCEQNLIAALTDSYLNVTKYKAYVFKYDGDLYRIPYDDILFFEIDSDCGYVNIITKNKRFTVKKTISGIIKELNDPRFMKTHKSCIINLYNVEKVDLTNLIITFTNEKQTDLLSRNYKKELQERIVRVKL